MENKNEWKILNKEMKIIYNKIKESEEYLWNIPKDIDTPYDFLNYSLMIIIFLKLWKIKMNIWS